MDLSLIHSRIQALMDDVDDGAALLNETVDGYFNQYKDCDKYQDEIINCFPFQGSYLRIFENQYNSIWTRLNELEKDVGKMLVENQE